MSDASALPHLPDPQELDTSSADYFLLTFYAVEPATAPVAAVASAALAGLNTLGCVAEEVNGAGDYPQLRASQFFLTAPAGTQASHVHQLLGCATMMQEHPEVALAVVPASAVLAQRRMLIMDVDSTLLNEEVIEELADYAGVKAEVAAITEQAMRGELDFTQSLKARVGTLRGLATSVIEEVAQQRISLTTGARALIGAYQQRGWPVCVVSGGFVQVLQPVAEKLGLDRYEANVLEITGRPGEETLTGDVVGEVVDAGTKAKMLHQWAAEFAIEPEAVMAIGDGANDIQMLQAAGFGVAFCAKEALKAHADALIEQRHLDVAALITGLPYPTAAQ